MTQADLQATLTQVAEALGRLGIPYHVTGGLASSYFGEPRLTQDIDLVLRLEVEAAERLVELLEGDFFIQREAVVDSVRRGTMFQALQLAHMVRVDFHVGERVPGELERSVEEALLGERKVRVVQKEDAILSKLLWVQEGIAKSRADVIGMLLDPSPFDRTVVERRARDLGCEELFREILRDLEVR